MPSLQFFGRSWNIGSDDLVFPATIDAVLHVYWLGRTVLQSNQDTSSMFLFGGFALSVCQFCCSSFLVHVSLRGSLINTYPRRKVRPLIALKFGLSLLGFTSLILCTPFTFSLNPIKNVSFSCQRLLLTTTLSSLLCLSLFLYKKRDKHHNHKTALWRRFIDYAGSLLGLKTSDPNLAAIAEVMYDLFYDEGVDLVASDIFSGLLLVQAKQLGRKDNLQKTAISQEPKSQPAFWMSAEQAVYFMKFAVAAYGWKFTMLQGPILSSLKYLLSQKGTLPERLKCNTEMMRHACLISHLTGCLKEDIIHVDIQNQLFEIPYFVALDKKTRNIVIAIRGTNSIDDVLIDLLAKDCEEMKIVGVEGATAHYGMLKTANNLMNKLKTILPEAVKRAEACWGCDGNIPIMVVGHSLGAGVAAIVAILLRESSNYSHIRCFSFSPPGGLLSKNISERIHTFVCSVILEDDIVGRLGINTAFQLKLKILKEIRDCNIPKYEVLMGSLLKNLCYIVGFNLWDNHLKQVDETMSNEEKQQIMVFKSNIDKVIAHTEEVLAANPPKVPPGQVLYIEEKRKYLGFNDYKSTWLSNDSPILEEIILTGDMVGHHMPWTVIYALTKLKAPNMTSPDEAKCEKLG